MDEKQLRCITIYKDSTTNISIQGLNPRNERRAEDQMANSTEEKIPVYPVKSFFFIQRQDGSWCSSLRCVFSKVTEKSSTHPAGLITVVL